MQIKARICDGKIVEIWIITSVAEDGFAEDWNSWQHPRNDDGTFRNASSIGFRKWGIEKHLPKPRLVRVKTFCILLERAKNSVPAKMRWRVSSQNPKEMAVEHANAKTYAIGKSTVVIDKGDIIGVCMHTDDRGRGKKNRKVGTKLLSWALKNGGEKLDSYAGNHGFYIKNGFEPVSWCEFDESFMEGTGWDSKRDEQEPIIFYRYIGKNSERHKEIMEEYNQNEDKDGKIFCSKIEACKDYHAAKKKRDGVIEEWKKQKIQK